MLLRRLCITIIKGFGQSCLIHSVRRRWRNGSFHVVSSRVPASDDDLSACSCPQADACRSRIVSADHGADRFDALMLMDQGGISSCRPSILAVRSTFFPRTQEEEEEEEDDVYVSPGRRIKPPAAIMEIENNSRLTGEIRSEQNPVDEPCYFEEADRLTIKLMVVEAVWKGAVQAMEDEAAETVMLKQAESLKAKEELECKDNEGLNLVSEKKNDECQGQANAEENTIDNNRNMMLLQSQLEQRIRQVRELETGHSILQKEVELYKAEAEDQRTDIMKQRCLNRDAERRDEVLVIVVKHLVDRTTELNCKIREYEDSVQEARPELQETRRRHELESSMVTTMLERTAAELHSKLKDHEKAAAAAHDEMQEQKWRHEAEKLIILNTFEGQVKEITSRLLEAQRAAQNASSEIQERNWCHEAEMSLILSILEGKVAELQSDLPVLLENILTDRLGTGSFKSRVLQRLGAYIKDLLSSKAALESRLELLEASTPRDECKPVDKTTELNNAERRIGALGESLKEIFRREELQNFETKFPQMTRTGEFPKEQQKAVKESIPPDNVSLEESSEEEVWFSATEKSFSDSYSEMPFKEDQLAREEATEPSEIGSNGLEEALFESSAERTGEYVIIRGYMEILCQQMEQMWQQFEKKSSDARTEAEEKTWCIQALENEISQLRNQVVVLTGGVSSLNGQLKVSFQRQVETVMTSLQELEASVSGRLDSFGSRVEHAYETMSKMKKEFDGKFQDMLRSVHCFGEDLSSRLEGFAFRLQEGDNAVRNARAEFDQRLETVLTSMHRLEGDADSKLRKLDTKIGLAFNLLEFVETGFETHMKSLISSARRIEGDLTCNVEKLDTRLLHVQSKLKQLSYQLKLSEERNIKTAHDLEKAEAEVDLLGDENVALVDLLEKVYTILSHYYPVIQLYPGLADVSLLVKQEVLRLSASDTGESSPASHGRF